jgi:hypothetical protein
LRIADCGLRIGKTARTPEERILACAVKAASLADDLARARRLEAQTMLDFNIRITEEERHDTAGSRREA